MKRKLKWLAIVLTVSLLGFGTALLLWPRDRITAESWQKIRIGMTEEEVAEILDGAGMTLEEDVRLEKALGGEDQAPWLAEPLMMRGGLFWHRDKIWVGRRGRIVIELDRDEHVR